DHGKVVPPPVEHRAPRTSGISTSNRTALSKAVGTGRYLRLAGRGDDLDVGLSDRRQPVADPFVQLPEQAVVRRDGALRDFGLAGVHDPRAPLGGRAQRLPSTAANPGHSLAVALAGHIESSSRRVPGGSVI